MNSSADINSKSFKTMLKSWRFWKPVVAVAGGGFAGFLYYYFIGCNSGTCAITGNPYMSIIWGGLLGFFVISSPCSRNKC